MAARNSEPVSRLEERCRELGVKLVYGELSGEGGLCRLRDDHILIINRRSSALTRARIIADALGRLEARAAAGPARAGDGICEAGCRGSEVAAVPVTGG